MIKKPQSYKPYWVRKRIFKCGIDEVDDYYNWINTNKNFIVFGYGEFCYSEESVNIPVYYLEKADLTDENPYKQIIGWQSDPSIAPADALEWNSAS